MKYIDKGLTWFENTVLVAGSLAVTFVLFSNVILRYFFGSGLVWAEEFSRYAIIWIVMGGLGAAVREDVHMRITALIDFSKNKKFIDIVNMAVALFSSLFGVFLLTTGIQLIQSQMKFNQLSPAMEIPLWWIYISIPIGGFLLTVRYIQSFVKQWNAFKGKGETA